MKRLAVGVAVMLLSVGMVVYALTRDFRAYREDRPAGDLVFFDTINEAALVEDSTFAGVVRSDLTGRLISTYDRSRPKGRPACPT